MEGQERLLKDSDFDKLTGLYTIDSFRNQLINLGDKIKKDKMPMCVLFFDVSNFKRYNEKHGFEKGDKLLKLIGSFLMASFLGATIARFSEDHFVTICYKHELEGNLGNLRAFTHGAIEFRDVSLRVGIYNIKKSDTDIMLCCDRAKIAADSIRRSTDITIREFDKELEQNVRRKHYLIENLDTAIEKRYIRAFFQPIVRSITGKLCAMEALARWIDPKLGVIGPEMFVSILEDEYLIHKLDLAIVEDACREFKNIEEIGYGNVPISINLSRLDFELCDIFYEIESIMAKYNIDRKYLIVEITESVLTESSDFIGKQIDKFHAAGYRVWMDDFGSEFSSMSILKDFDFDAIKLDMMFVKDFGAKSKTIMTSVIEMAKSLGMLTLAEGVESKAQADFLYNIGCELQQGFYYGRPSLIGDRQWKVNDLNAECVEKTTEREYMNKIGKVQLTGTRIPNYFNEEKYNTNVAIYSYPMAIIEEKKENLHHMFTNKAYMDLLEKLDVIDIIEADLFMNDLSNCYVRRIKQVFDNLIMTDDFEVEDIIVENQLWHIKVTRIASIADRVSFKLEILRIEPFLKTEENQNINDGLRELNVIYEHVDILHLKKGYSEPIYESSNYKKVYNIPNLDEAISIFAKSSIHEYDRTRYLEYMDISTVIDRIHASKYGFLAENFRFRKNQHEDEFIWKVMFLIDVSDRSENKVMASIVPLNDGLIKALDAYSDKEEQYVEYLTNEDQKEIRINAISDIPIPFGVYEIKDGGDGINNVICHFMNAEFAALTGTNLYEFTNRVAEPRIKGSKYSWQEMARMMGQKGQKITDRFYFENIGHYIKFNGAPIQDKNCFAITFSICDEEQRRFNRVYAMANQSKIILLMVKLLRDSTDFKYRMYRVLEMLSKELGARRVFIMERKDNKMAISFEYHKTDLDSASTKFELNANKFLMKWENKANDDGIIDIPDINVTTESSPDDYKVFKKLKASSMCTVFIMEQGRVIGTLNVQDYDEELINKYRSYLSDISYLIGKEMTQNVMFDKLDFYANYDVLTGAQNRNSLIRKEHELVKYRIPCGIVSGDINGLKKLNDTKGHGAGDQLLKNAAEMLIGHFGKEHTYRAGGDEFTVIMEDVDKDEFEKMFEEFKEIEKKSEVSISLASVWNEDSGKLKDILQEADSKMYEAKKSFYENQQRDRRHRG